MLNDGGILFPVCITVAFCAVGYWLLCRPIRYLPCSDAQLPVELRQAVRAQAVERERLGFFGIHPFRRLGGGDRLWAVLAFNQEAQAVVVYVWKEGIRKEGPWIHVVSPVDCRLQIGFESLVSDKRIVTVNLLVPLLENIWNYDPDSITQEFDTISSLTAAWEHHREELQNLRAAPRDIKLISQTAGLNLLERKPIPLSE